MKTPDEVIEIEARAQAAGVSMDEVLRRSGVAVTTWWRWSEGRFEPRLATLRKVRQALDEEISAHDATGDRSAA